MQQGAAVDEAEGHAKALIRRVLYGYDLTKLEHVEDWEDPNNPRDLRQRPCIIIPDWEHTAHIDGTVVDTNGVVIPIKDLVDRRIAKYGFAVTVYNDANGVMRPHDVLPIKRLAGPPTPIRVHNPGHPPFRGVFDCGHIPHRVDYFRY